MRGADKIDFKKVKSSYLEKDLKIKNCVNAKKLNTKSDKIIQAIKNKTNVNSLENFDSFQNKSNEKGEQKYNNIENSLVEQCNKNLEQNKNGNKEKDNNLGELGNIENKEQLKNEETEENAKNEENEENEKSAKNEGTEESAKNEEMEESAKNKEMEENTRDKAMEENEYYKILVSKKNENFKEVSLKNKISTFLNKTKDAYNSLKVDKIFLCNNINNLINDKNSDINIDGSYDVKKKYIYEYEKTENVPNNTRKDLSVVKTLEDKIRNNNSVFLKNIYYAFKGTLNDFIDVYLEKDNDDIESMYDKIYYSNSMVHKIENKDVIGTCGLLQNTETSKIKKNKLINEVNIRKNKTVINDIYNQKDKKFNKEYIHNVRENNKSHNIPNNMKDSFINEKEKHENNDNDNDDINRNKKNTIYKCKIREANIYNTMNNLDGGELVNENVLNSKKLVSSEINKNMNYDDMYHSNKNKFEYSDIISSYLYNNENINNKYTTKNNYDVKNEVDIKKKNESTSINYTQKKKKSKIIDVQINDKNVFDISPLTQKYKYRSNIILTINKIKNIEKIIEINVSITDIQLKIPGMRIENIILPYKYSNDLLAIQIKTLCDGEEQVDEIEKERNHKNKNNITEKYEEPMANYQLKEESSSTIKYYYVFIPLDNIKEEIINKQLILITSKYKKIFEKEKLLPDTMYLIQSKNIDSVNEKHLYISIKKCVNGIHFYPSINENNLNNLNKNNILNSKGGDNRFKPVYVSLYNDEVDREIGNLINENNLINKIKIEKLPEKGYYIINNNYFYFFFNKENILVCNNNINNKMDKNQSNIENASNLFNLISNNFIIVKSYIDLFPFYIFPSLEDVEYFDFIEKNEYIKLKFMLHFLAIMENICTNLCSLININTKTHSLFHNHIKAVQIDDENNKRSYFTFLYTSYDERSKITNNPFNYIKPFIFQFQEENNNNEEKESILDELNDNDLFIYNYARKQSLFLYNIIKNYDDIKNISKFYDEKKHIFYTADYKKKQFQDYYINILYKYNKLVEEDIYYKENSCNFQERMGGIHINEKEKMKNNLRQHITLKKNSSDKINQNNYQKIAGNRYSSDNFSSINNNGIILKQETKINNENKENHERLNTLNKKEFHYHTNFNKNYYINDIEPKNNNLSYENGAVEKYNNLDILFKTTNNKNSSKIIYNPSIHNKEYNNRENKEFFNFKENNNYYLYGKNSNMEEKRKTTLNMEQNKNLKEDINYISNTCIEKKTNTLNTDIYNNNHQPIYSDQLNTSKNEKEHKMEQQSYSNNIVDIYEYKKEHYMNKKDLYSQEYIKKKTNYNLDLSSEKLLLKSDKYFNGSNNINYINENEMKEYESMHSNVMNFSENDIILSNFSDEDENNSINISTSNIMNNNLCIEKNKYYDKNKEKKVEVLNFENLKIHNDNINKAEKKCKLVQGNVNKFLEK